MKKNLGFTLIEILIVLGIIGIMVTIATFGLTGAREAARDAKRKTDLENIRTALELYFSDCRAYPVNIAAGIIGDGSTTDCSASNVYMSSVPTDPQTPTRDYFYQRPTATSYVLCTSLEDEPNPALDVTGCGSCGEVCNYSVSGP